MRTRHGQIRGNAHAHRHGPGPSHGGGHIRQARRLRRLRLVTAAEHRGRGELGVRGHGSSPLERRARALLLLDAAGVAGSRGSLGLEAAEPPCPLGSGREPRAGDQHARQRAIAGAVAQPPPAVLRHRSRRWVGRLRHLAVVASRPDRRLRVAASGEPRLGHQHRGDRCRPELPRARPRPHPAALSGQRATGRSWRARHLRRLGARRLGRAARPPRRAEQPAARPDARGPA